MSKDSINVMDETGAQLKPLMAKAFDSGAEILDQAMRLLQNDTNIQRLMEMSAGSQEGWAELAALVGSELKGEWAGERNSRISILIDKFADSQLQESIESKREFAEVMIGQNQELDAAYEIFAVGFELGGGNTDKALDAFIGLDWSNYAFNDKFKKFLKGKQSAVRRWAGQLKHDGEKIAGPYHYITLDFIDWLNEKPPIKD